MITSPLERQDLVKATARQAGRLQTATLVMVCFILLSSGIVGAWFAGEGTIQMLFAQLHRLQESPPLWLAVPMVMGEYLLAPTILLLFVVLTITKVSPRTQAWSRFAVVTILLVLLGRYLLWRSLSTLNLADPLNGVFSLGLFGLELLMLTTSSIQLFLMLKGRDGRRPAGGHRQREADQYSLAVIEGRFAPTVDILIPTYNEPAAILRRTVIGCQALDYPHKTIYVLDDTRRSQIQALAAELGCRYLTRPDNHHAKAGNLNHAIAQTQGELIVVFDADFVPTRNFLTRTLGFFQDLEVALVQTPQSFYNADPIARNLRLENVLTPEEEVFYRQIQPLRDAADSVVCSGTSFVVRRTALEEIGGFVTDSLSEDYFTGVRLSAQGYRLIYLDEKLSAGLAAENIAAHAAQRLRWARGTLQAFFIRANPLTIPGLAPWQRLAHLEGLLHWFTSLSLVGFLLIPLAYSFLGVIPVRTTATELVYFFLPYYLVQWAVFSWLNHRSRSAVLSSVYSLILCFPLAWLVIQVMLRPFSQRFKVTPKGTVRDRPVFNWQLAWPLILLFVVTAVSLWRNLGLCLIQSGTSWGALALHKGMEIAWLWSAYNLMLLAIALLILVDAPKPDPYEWFDLRRVVRVNFSGQTGWGITTMISETGAEIALTQMRSPLLAPGTSLPVSLEIVEEGLQLQGQLVCTGFQDEFPIVRVQFEALQLEQQRQLIELLFCRPNQWKYRESPGELQSLWLLVKVLLMPHGLWSRRPRRAVSVAKV